MRSTGAGPGEIERDQVRDFDSCVHMIMASAIRSRGRFFLCVFFLSLILVLGRPRPNACSLLCSDTMEYEHSKQLLSGDAAIDVDIDVVRQTRARFTGKRMMRVLLSAKSAKEGREGGGLAC
jgi:hypothetical protein